jgi:hypothetical protein
MIVNEGARKIGLPTIIGVTNEDATTTIGGYDCILRNTGDDAVYFAINTDTAVTALTGHTLQAGDTFPLVLSIYNIRTISGTSSTLEVVKL